MTMATVPQNEEPGIGQNVKKLPKDQENGSPDTLEVSLDVPATDEDEDKLDVEKRAAEERKERGHQ
jgi:hypothetical protein